MEIGTVNCIAEVIGSKIFESDSTIPTPKILTSVPDPVLAKTLNSNSCLTSVEKLHKPQKPLLFHEMKHKLNSGSGYCSCFQAKS